MTTKDEAPRPRAVLIGNGAALGGLISLWSMTLYGALALMTHQVSSGNTLYAWLMAPGIVAGTVALVLASLALWRSVP